MRLRESLRRFPVVVLSGARQTGKTTLVRSSPIATRRTYRTLDDLDAWERAEANPDAFLDEGAQMTLDEVQRAPRLLHAIKRAVDRRRTPGQFLLTGSANLLMMRRVSESLAGRAVYLHLYPMTEAEKSGRPVPGLWGSMVQARSIEDVRKLVRAAPLWRDWARRAWVGGYPVPVTTSARTAPSEWFDGYVQTYLERDLHDIASIAALADFRRLMKLAALRVGQVLNQSELARDAALPQPTAHRYLNLLETSHQIVRIPAFFRNRSKRLVKSPKLYWSDTGLGAFLAGLSTPEDLARSDRAGAWMENFVLLHLFAWRETAVPRPEIHYWRTTVGEEVDFVIEQAGRLLPIEVKLSARLRPSDTKSLRVFVEEYHDLAPLALLLYGGNEVIPLDDRILAVPIPSALGPI